MARHTAPVYIEDTAAGGLNPPPEGVVQWDKDTDKLYVSDGASKLQVYPGSGSYTDENAQDAVGGILADTSTINFTYDDTTPEISAIVIDDSITFAKMQNISTDRLLGRESASSGNVEEISLGSGLSMSSTTLNVDLSAIMPACRLTKSADQSGIIAGDELSWDQEDFDTDTLHDNSTNNSRITTSQSGVWLVGCAINTQNTTISPIYAILLNGTTNITASERVLQTSSSSKYYNFSTIWNATAGDYFEVSCINGTSHVVEADNSSFWAIKLR